MPDPVAPHPEPGAWQEELQAFWQARREQRDPPPDETPVPRPRLGILCDLSASLAYSLVENLHLARNQTVAGILRQAAHLRWPSGFSESEVEQRIDRVLSQVGLTAMRDRSFLQLSGGQRQRLGQAIDLLIGESSFSPLTSQAITFTVWNQGNLPSTACHVEVYEGPEGYTSLLPAYDQRGSAVIALMPGEWREVTLPWSRQQAHGRVVGLCYDPLLDPLDFQVVVQGNRHLWSIHY